MKSSRAAKYLGISMDTLKRYREDGKLIATQPENNQWVFDRASVQKYKEALQVVKGTSTSEDNRKSYGYVRASNGTKEDIKRQEETVLQFAEKECKRNRTKLSSKVFKDYCSVDLLGKRFALKNLMNRVFDFKVDTIYALGIDRFGFIDAELFRMILANFGTKLRLMDEEIPEIAKLKPSNEEFAGYNKVKKWYSNRSRSSKTDRWAIKLERATPVVKAKLMKYKGDFKLKDYWELKTAFTFCKNGVHHQDVRSTITRHTGMAF